MAASRSTRHICVTVNMKEKINAYPEVLDKLRKAFINSGVAIREKAIRTGDGAFL